MNSAAAAGRLSRDTEAVLLLCGVFGGRASGGVEPLTTREYNEVARWLAGKGLRPSALVDGR